MSQVVLERFSYWAPFRSREGKYLRIRFILSRDLRECPGVDFCSVRSIQPSPVSTVAGFHVPVFQKRGQGRTKPSSVTGQGSSCRPVRIHCSQIISSAAPSKLLFCGQRQLFFRFSLGFSRKRLELHLPQKSGVGDNGKRLVVWRLLWILWMNFCNTCPLLCCLWDSLVHNFLNFFCG